MAEKKISREELARIEIGRTDISRSLSVQISIFFLLFIFLIPVGQYVADKRNGTTIVLPYSSEKSGSAGESFYAQINRQNKAVLKNIHHFETELEDNSLLREFFLPPMQYVLFRFLNQGNEKALAGRKDWLFFSSDVDYLTGQPFLDPHQIRTRAEAHEIWEKPFRPDPLAAIVDFKEQLEKRGIELLVVPIPIKAAIEPEMLSSRRVEKPLANRSWPGFVRSLEENGVQFFDARSLLAEYTVKNGHSFFATDTHWLPGAMRHVVEALAQHVTQMMPDTKGTTTYSLQSQWIAGEGDIARMFTLPEKTSLFQPEQVEISQIMSEAAEFWQPDRNAEIMLLGDSFTNIYSLKGLGWGFAAGFAEHLSYGLQQPLDLLARNDSGAYVTREMLATELARGRDRLAGKKLVIWQFAERELAFGDWKYIDLQLVEAKESRFLVVQPGEKILVAGVVGAISRSARPGSVPYRDNIVTLHLLDLLADDRQLEHDQTLVYGWGMRDNQLTDLASLRPGDAVTFTLSSWEDLEGEYGSYRRTPLDDEMMELELPNWGELIDDQTD